MSVLILLCCLQETVDNIEFARWQGFSEGAIARYQTLSEANNERREGRATYRLVRSTSEKHLIDFRLVMPGAPDMAKPTEIPAKVDKERAWWASAKKLSEAEEEVTVGRSKLKCKVVEWKLPGGETTKLWTHPEIPGHVVKAASKGPAGSNTLTLQTWNAKPIPVESLSLVKDWVFAPGKLQIARIVNVNGKYAISVDEKVGPSFDRVSLPQFSADGVHVAYQAQSYSPTGAELLLLIDHKVVYKGPWDRRGGLKQLVVAPDGSKVVALFEAGMRGFVIIEGKATPEYDRVFQIGFTPDGKPYYAAQIRELDKTSTTVIKNFLVIGDQRKELPSGHSLFVSLDGQRSAVVSAEGIRHVLTVDGKKSEPYQELHSFQWSPDSKHYAYVVGARESSPSAFVVLDGQAGDRYAQVNHLRFSPDGRRLAVVARESLRAPGDVLVVDKKKEYSAPAILAPLFSPDGKKVACFTLGKTSSLVINGVVASDVGTLEDIQNSSLVWSADSRHFAYVARSPKEPGKLVLVVDGKQVGEEAGQIGRPIFLGNVLHYISVNLGFGEWGKVDLQ